MRILCGVAAIGLLCACAGRTEATSPAAAGATGAPAFTAVGTGPAAGAQAPEQLTLADLESRMKDINQHNQTMRKHLTGGMGADAAKEAEQLARLFGDVERFWAQRKRTDAVKWAQDARTFATEAAGAATANDVMKATQAANNMLGACKQCHGTYREMDPAGGFRIRADQNIS
jgi:hypothetical protein